MKIMLLNTLLLLQSTVMDDPGMPGGDPDVPEVPLDSGLFILIAIALVCGIWRLRQMNEATGRS